MTCKINSQHSAPVTDSCKAILVIKKGGPLSSHLSLAGIYELALSTIDSLIHGSLANQFFLLNYYTINSTAFSALRSALLQCV